MKLTFLGTGTSQGIPVIGCGCEVCQSGDARDRRLRTSALLETGKTTVVFDTGPDFRQQMLNAKVQWMDGFVFTHKHKDHTAGLDDIRPFYFHQECAMDLYGSRDTLDQLKRDYAYFFEEHRYPGVPEVNLHYLGDEPFTIGDIELTPVPVLHYKLPVLGFRAGDLAYITDANEISEASREKLRGLKVLVLNALRRKSHISHFTLEQAIEVVTELQPERAYFTHLSHLMGRHADVSAELPENIEIAYDGLVVEV